MAHFTVVVPAPLAATVAWARVLDLAAHGDVIPLTSLHPLPDRACSIPDRACSNPDRACSNPNRECSNPDRECSNPDRACSNPDRECSNPNRECSNPDRACSNPDRECGRGSEAGPQSMAARDLTAGSRFVARTALGRLGFDDPMVIESLRSPEVDLPGFARIRKQGNVIRGWIDLTITSVGSTSSRVTWSQVISVTGFPRTLDPLVALVARIAYGWALRRLLARG